MLRNRALQIDIYLLTQNLFVYQILMGYLNPWLRYDYFRFL